ncbi:MAG: phosphoesterase [Thermoguttaceae bacterium]|nr:phosphoesterase [Thermoguttaceae bacterium]
MSAKDDEMILVVPTELFRSIGYFQGFCSEPGRYAPLLSPANLSFRRRGDMESNPAFKQLIPYMLFTHTAADGRVSVFGYVRGKGMGEARLHNLMSVGVGGHINDTDLARAAHRDDGRDIYREGLLRELREEVAVGSPYVESCVGLINDDRNEVGRVHLGVVHRFELESPRVTPNEPDLIESGFYEVNGLLESGRAFETWSSITLRALFGR